MSLCLQKDPAKRPTAKVLIKHKFIKLGKKTGMLTDLIERRRVRCFACFPDFVAHVFSRFGRRMCRKKRAMTARKTMAIRMTVASKVRPSAFLSICV